MQMKRTTAKTGPKPRPLAERFWPKVEKTDGCWLWTGATSTGYGAIGIGGHRAGFIYAHRVSWELAYGPIPDGMCVLHRCDVRNCVRPDHLFLGTKSDNTIDMMAKRRSWMQQPGNALRGERHGNARLTEAQVIEIRQRFDAGESRANLKTAFGIPTHHLHQILTRKSWRHLP